MLHSTLLRTAADQLLSTTIKKSVLSSGPRLVYYSSSSEIKNEIQDDIVFEPPQIFPPTQQDIVKGRTRRDFGEKMEKNTIEELPTDIDWPSVWSTAQTFDPNRVPLPLYQGK